MDARGGAIRIKRDEVEGYVSVLCLCDVSVCYFMIREAASSRRQEGVTS